MLDTNNLYIGKGVGQAAPAVTRLLTINRGTYSNMQSWNLSCICNSLGKCRVQEESTEVFLFEKYTVCYMLHVHHYV